MKKILIIVSLLALLEILACAILVFLGRMPHSRFVVYTNMATLVWFVTAPFWLAPKKDS
jgi:hypothetical protein